ncbi:hypothetical protein A2130_04225 [Candidatus Woesebacteria bacterium GWC2_33_12]|uniref:Type II secretion system protein G n=1 Tax=Candidatus Woesebacteria bacterium GW2011_GWB1_33_22 TaxID=1618566 RepID=A0A0F9ZI38_9BACT|nr:MAG: hypothetical protein UR29_C0018G0006 [Candidatus Woesebacteria bacterium GW2011_GWC2_33_12]KKP41446.1 MAG: hypothetical protein UR33_C0016G0007 [Candidatus Woesebacteria bacterium GW2011_GWA2_33_20]KKP43828.1 MAG: hypothetical protein UR35_C0016G0006 [Candidatus Woesebacteria bacterium GW2011_GWB1_33_22]KKP45398.1 MAG: hypothetical protein UR37_C0018G0006 [Microgenomates group bacterium GW2011_GWC1_33_28]KKP49280.1 MAG: hypothetical protein UR41_C0017G0006 [Candidatus Woesebacteria bact
MVNRFIKKITKSFTLVEILVVIALIGGITIFSAVEIPAQMQKVRDAVRKTHIDTMKKAIDEYYQDSGCYPQTIPTCKNSLILGDLVIKDNLPCDPKLKLSYTYVPEVSECPKWFQLYANLEYTSDSIIDRVGCRNGCGPICQFNYGAASSNQKLNPFCEQSSPSAPGAPASEPSPSPDPDPEGSEIQLQYVCSPSGACEAYIDPALSGCPNVYLNDPLCQNACEDRDNRCHDSRGKQN